ncbi:site-specific integrase [Psychrobacillus phage Perkons]|nr:site-specific integrase [Psychrobacillus phage Perkons]
MTKTIEMNMHRERAKKLPVVTDEIWMNVNEDYRTLVEEFVSVQNHSNQTKKQYISSLKQFGFYLFDAMNNKPLHKVTKRDFLRYISYLRDNRKMSSSGIGMKKAAVSSLCNYIENVVSGDDEDESYKNFRSFTRGLPAIPKNVVYEKIKITYAEYQEMMSVLENDENYLGMAWLSTAFNVGARRSEIVQFKSEIVDYEMSDDATFVYSHNIRLKGSGIDGKIEPYMINLEAIKYMKLWMEKRGYEHEYIFTTKYNGEITPTSPAWADYFCTHVLSDILGRRVNPHLFKASCITYLLEQGIKLELVSKYVAHHENVATTIAHYDLRNFEEEKNGIFK